MKKHLYIVEGKTDVSKLRTLGINYIIKTDGLSYVSRETINLIKSASLVRPIVLLLDPDGPGRKIKEKIIEAIKDVENYISITNIEVDKHLAIGHKKVGIAQMKIQDLKEYLDKYLKEDANSEQEIIYTISDLIELKLNGNSSKENRIKIATKFPLNISTSKTLIESLNILQIDKEELRRIINE